MKVTIYTDGSARGNPDGPGGYGTILSYIDSNGTEHLREYSQGYKKTTNNRMEIMAVIAGFEALNRPCQVDVYSDSQYVINTFNPLNSFVIPFNEDVLTLNLFNKVKTVFIKSPSVSYSFNPPKST